MGLLSSYDFLIDNISVGYLIGTLIINQIKVKGMFSYVQSVHIFRPISAYI